VEGERQKAYRLWEESGRKKTVQEIALEIGIPLPTVKSWKQRDAWGKDAKDASKQKDATQRRRKQANRRAVEQIEKNEALTERERDFCAAYWSVPNPSQAALKTGRYKNRHSAEQAAYEMLKKKAVQEEIQRLRKIKKNVLMAEGDDYIDILRRAATTDMTSIVEFNSDGVAINNSEMVDGVVITEVSQGRNGIKVKRVDPLKAIELYYKLTGQMPMDQHRIKMDNAKLKMEQDKAGGEGAVEVKLHIPRPEKDKNDD